MTTFLAIYATASTGEIRVAPLCERCRSVTLDRRDDHYEFDETCEICGTYLPASPSVDEILAIEEEVERRAKSLAPTPPLLL